MRKILFRGAQKVDGSKSLYWYEGSLVSEKDCYTGEVEYYIENENGSFLVIPETVGQYTGLKDKNGTKIFEGDIVKYRNDFPCKIYYINSQFVMMWENCYRSLEQVYDDEIEVIGNIYDTPELLKEAEQE